MVHAQYAIPIEDRKSFHDCVSSRFSFRLKASLYCDSHELGDKAGAFVLAFSAMLDSLRAYVRTWLRVSPNRRNHESQVRRLA